MGVKVQGRHESKGVWRQTVEHMRKRSGEIERESKRVIRGPREIYNTGNKPNWPPNKRSMEHIRFYVVPIQGNENNYRVHA